MSAYAVAVSPGSPAYRNPYLYRPLGQVQLGGQLAPRLPRDVVLLGELPLQPGDLLPREGRPVPSDLAVVDRVPGV